MSTIAMWLVKTLLILACCSPIFARKDAPSKAGVVGYLEKYGYLEPPPPNTAASRSEESLAKAISALQFFMGLNVTGIEDKETLRLIQSPRCGMKDINNKNNLQAIVRGDFQQSPYIGELPWQKNSITYSITEYAYRLNRQDVEQTIAAAFDVWAQRIPIKFTRVSGPADIDIRFATGDHGDGDPFDGPQGTLAHAAPPGPGIGGDVHFDDEEFWTIGGGRGTDLLWVAVHEIGHALGLNHAYHRPLSIMYPEYRPNALAMPDRSDIANSQAVYGKKNEDPVRNPVYPGRWGHPRHRDWDY